MAGRLKCDFALCFESKIRTSGNRTDSSFNLARGRKRVFRALPCACSARIGRIIFGHEARRGVKSVVVLGGRQRPFSEIAGIWGRSGPYVCGGWLEVSSLSVVALAWRPSSAAESSTNMQRGARSASRTTHQQKEQYSRHLAPSWALLSPFGEGRS